MGTWEDIKEKQKQKRLNNLRQAVAKADALPQGAPATDLQAQMQAEREAHASWKVVCECGEVKYFRNMDISQLNEEIQHNFHPKHMKAIFFREGLRHQFRGSIPAMVRE
jgi:hypothetical protein